MRRDLREALTAELQSRLRRHGVVMWEDPEREYEGVAEDVAPDGVEFQSFEGSWYELRRRIEDPLAEITPVLVIYVNERQPDESPLEEARTIGTRFTRRLSKLIRENCAKEVPPERLEEVVRSACTLEEAERLIDAGGGGAPLELVKAFGRSEPSDLVLRLVDGGLAETRSDEDLLDPTREFLVSVLGLSSRVKDADEVPSVIARHLVLVELTYTGIHVPERLSAALPEISEEQSRWCMGLLRRWASDETRRAHFRDVMRIAGEELSLASELQWSDAMTGVDTVPAYDELAIKECVNRLQTGEFEAGAQLAAAREASVWARIDADELGTLHHLWRTLGALSALRLGIAAYDPEATSLAAMAKEYAEKGWTVDQAHRRFERALLEVADRSAVEEVATAARGAYEEWLDARIRAFTGALEAEGLNTAGFLTQTEIDPSILAPRLKERSKVAFMVVDAFRLEMGHELRGMIERQFDGAEVEFHAALGVLPSTTTVGMAALCPDAASGLSLSVEGTKLRASIDGSNIDGPPDRLARFQAAYDAVADVRVDDLLRSTDQELSERFADAKLLIVRSQEIDESSEAGKLAIGLPSMDQMVAQLARSVARLHQQGFRDFVITSDHGFIILAREVGPHMIIPRPQAQGALQRRVFVGHGGTSGEELARIPISKLGFPGSLDLLLPRGLALFSAGGSRGFFHGGASPQELLIPAIAVRLPEPQGSAMVKISASLSSRITSEIFTGRIRLEPDLLSESISVRPTALREGDGNEVAVLATAGGAEEGEGLVRLEPDGEVTLGFRLTANLSRGDKVSLRVYDGRSDRTLSESDSATVSRSLVVEDELDAD